MEWIDRFEKLGRLVLWLTLAAMCVAAPLSFLASADESEALRSELARLQLQLEEAKRPPPPSAPPPISRLALEAMGTTMHSLDVRSARGRVYFSNVSQRSGVLCAIATVSNGTGARTESLPECRRVEPYETGLFLEFAFAGTALEELCKESDCTIAVHNRADYSDSAPGLATAPSTPPEPAPVQTQTPAAVAAPPASPRARPAPKPVALPPPAPTVAAPTRVPADDCNPPYVVDPATGVKRLKPACAR